jgi:hypothetical protein
VRVRIPLRRVLGSLPTFLAVVVGASPALTTEAEACWQLRDRRNALGEAAMKEELVLVRQIRERTCPALQQQAEAANANDRVFAPIDYQALAACRRRAEAQLEATHRPLYRNRLQFTYYTEGGAVLARQADGVARQMAAQGCPPGP